jgi:peroxiredoxin Q/BCP
MTSPYEEDTILKVGDPAPQFSLESYPAGQVSLKDFFGKQNVILAFYPKDNTPGCTKEMCTFSERRQEFANANTVILGVSTDDTTSHKDFATQYGLLNQLLSDTSRETGMAYGAVRGDRVIADRVLFVIDKKGLIRHVHSGQPDFDELLEIVTALEKLQADS